MVFATKKGLLTCSAVIALGCVPSTAWPIKTIDLSEDGALCDTSKEQYIQVEAYDYHDHPQFTLRWTQLTGECGVQATDPLSWERTYDSMEGGDDEPPPGDDRVQLNIFVCAPFGHYEIELEISSYSDDGSSRPQRTAWEIENGPDEYHIWDTVNTYLADDPDYSPTSPGTYSWPLDGETGYYSIIYAGPLPPTECTDSVPDGTVYKGCYRDSASSRVFDSGEPLVLPEMGRDGMTTDMCSQNCADYEYFAVEFGKECFCGTQDEFDDAEMLSPSASHCGNRYEYLCTGDATTACGGRNAMSVYMRTEDIPTPPLPGTFSSKGCYEDSKSNRIMSRKESSASMTAEFCSGRCNDDASNSHSHFGTQFGEECWCGSPDLPTQPLEPSECNYDCSGDANEKCGGYNRMSVYSYRYQGCYRDVRSGRVMGDMISGLDMTNELCQMHCEGLGTKYYGTQYGEECWCGDSFGTDKINDDDCDYACVGDELQDCGGFLALSVYTVA